MLTEQDKEQFRDLLDEYPSASSAVLPALHIAQQNHGFLNPETIRDIGKFFNMTPGEVEGIITFYTMYTECPLGKYRLQVCTNISCSLMGAQNIVDYICEKLGIGIGETTSDGKFTLQTAECLGTCGSAPVMLINDVFHENLTPEKIDQLIDNL